VPFLVAILDGVGYAGLDEPRAARLFAAALSRRGLDLERVGEVSVALVDAQTIRDLNVRFRGKDEPTDVLSFEVDGPYGEMVGEVVVCPACAGPLMDVEELVVHGALHLSGMDHGEDFEGSEMARVQEAVMGEVRGEGG
jgi:probable rRNA maturation factor